MTQQPHNPLQSRAFSLEFPQSLGTYQEYSAVQRMVDTLADAGFPVQNTLIVGTDLRLIERVTGRKTWGRVVLGGALSGVWMGLFVGLLFSMLSDNWFSTILSSVVLGAIFFTVWAVISHVMSGGERDFTSMTATVPMQYELLVEHRNVMEARRILTDAGVRLGEGAFGGASSLDVALAHSSHGPGTGEGASPNFGQEGPTLPSSNRPQYGQSAPPHSNDHPSFTGSADHHTEETTSNTPMNASRLGMDARTAGSDAAGPADASSPGGRTGASETDGQPRAINTDAPGYAGSAHTSDSANAGATRVDDTPSKRPTYGLPSDPTKPAERD